MAKLEKNIANVGSKVGKLGNNLVKQTNGMSKKLLPKKAYDLTHRYMYISFVVFVILLGFLLNFLYKKYVKKENMTEKESLTKDEDADDDEYGMNMKEGHQEDEEEEEDVEEEEDAEEEDKIEKFGLEGFTMY